MTQNSDLHQKLNLHDRNKLTVDCVNSIMDFSDTFLTLDTTLGIINVEGEGMIIEELSKDNGTIIITGLIDGIFFKKSNASKGVFSKIFK